MLATGFPRRGWTVPKSGAALLTDLYQLNMMAAYLEHGLTETAVFELFVRNLPAHRGFLMAAGLDQALEFLETIAFTEEDLAAIRQLGRFSDGFLDYLGSFRFTGEVEALPEGTVFFPDEPIIRVTAPLPEAQFVETRLVNLVHFETVIASKAARMVLAAPGKALIDYGLRRAHGAEAGLLAARASYIAGFSGTATVAAGVVFGIPVYGTMAHSFVQAHDDETLAFEHFALSRPQGLVLLIDTYDTERAAGRVVALAPRLMAQGITISGVRIDSGNLGEHAVKVRRILDAGGLPGRGSSPAAAWTRMPAGVVARRPTDRFLRHRHQPDDSVGRPGARLRLQAAGICRAASAQALGREGDVARSQAGVATL